MLVEGIHAGAVARWPHASHLPEIWLRESGGSKQARTHTMKIFLTSDLHGEVSDYRWIAEHARDYDLVCIAGDLIDAFDRRGLYPQIERVSDWCQEMRRLGVPVALCSGNHDAFDARFDCTLRGNSQTSHQSLIEALRQQPNWLQVLFADSVAVDGDTRRCGKEGDEILVTCLPYDFGVGDQLSPEGVWDNALAIHRHSRLPWLVLHHEPPMDCRVGGCYGSQWIREKLEEAMPDYLLSGHIHSKPFEEGGSWSDRIGKTWCFNPGKPEYCPVAMAPNHILLDTKKGNATWNYYDEGINLMQKKFLLWTP